MLTIKKLTLKNTGRRQHTKYPPKAFTERGPYMLATTRRVNAQSKLLLVHQLAAVPSDVQEIEE